MKKPPENAESGDVFKKCDEALRLLKLEIERMNRLIRGIRSKTLGQ